MPPQVSPLLTRRARLRFALMRVSTAGSLLVIGVALVAAPRARQAFADAPPVLSGVQDAIARALEYTVTLEGNGIYGSGILVDAQAGHLLTNWHVVSEMSPPIVLFHDGKRVAGRVLAVDRALDLALVAVPPRAGPRPVWSDAARLRPGDELYAIGCPRHLAFTVSRGIASFVGREVEGARWLQTDLPINDGNSGGPVLNSRGELVGIMTFIYQRSQGLSFALPSEIARARYAELKRDAAK